MQEEVASERGRSQRVWSPELFRRIVVPVDFTEPTRRAFLEALSLSRLCDGAVHLMSLVLPGECDEFIAGVGGGAWRPGDYLDEANAGLRRFVDHVAPEEAERCQYHVAIGDDIVRNVLEVIDRVDATLVLIGADTATGIFRSPVERIARRAPCSVLLLAA